MQTNSDKKKILSVNQTNFDQVALNLFRFQYENNSVYQSYCNTLNRGKGSIHEVEEIPFLPIEFFKTHPIQSTNSDVVHIFESSGTTGDLVSEHLIFDLDWYKIVSEKVFENEYGPIKDYCILALLPSYLERNQSSLVYMVDQFITKSKYDTSAFYLDDHQKLYKQLKFNESNQIKTLLLGVTFGLLDFAENFQIALNNTIIMETGGMKGRRKELMRSEVHQILKSAFKLDTIHSEYGMTELMSQAYSKGNGTFKSPNWMKAVITELNDPFSQAIYNQSGRVNIIDLANIDSCAFIQTSDLGKTDEHGNFEILGRVDQSDLRGCNLMLPNI